MKVLDFDFESRFYIIILLVKNWTLRQNLRLKSPQDNRENKNKKVPAKGTSMLFIFLIFYLISILTSFS
jgi:hypothetical protein